MLGISLWRGAGSNCKLHTQGSTQSKYLQVEFHELIYSHDRSLVTAAVAVVRRTKHSHNVAVVCPVIALHHQLMGTGDPGQVVRMVKLLWNILSKTVAGTSGRNTPTTSVIGIRPQKIAHGAFLGHLLNSIKLSNLVKSVNTWWQTTVQAENLVLNDSSEGQVVKEFSEDFPDVGVAVLSEALIVESIANTPFVTQILLTLGWFVWIRGYLSG